MCPALSEDIVKAWIGPEKVEPFIKGRELIEGGFLVKCGRYKENDRYLEILGLCLSITNMRGDPHEMKLILDKVTSGIHSASCSCKAGVDGKCKHCTAILLVLSGLDSVEQLPRLSCTETPCAWKRQNKELVENLIQVLPISQCCHFKASSNTNIESVPDEVQEQDFKTILDGFPNSEFTQFLQGRGTEVRELLNQSLEDELKSLFDFETSSSISQNFDELNIENFLTTCSKEQKEFYEKNIIINLETSIKIFSATRSQNDVTWKKFRQIRITGSIAKQIYGYTIPKNWAKKLEGIVFPNFKGNFSTKFGNRFERVALAKYADENPTGKLIPDPGLFIKPTCPWLGYSADGFFIENGKLLLLEVKSPARAKDLTSEQLLKKLDYLVIEGDKKDLKDTHEHYFQVQLGLYLFNLDLAIFIVYLKKDNRIITIKVEKNPNFHRVIKELTQRYFQFMLPYLVGSSDDLLITEFGIDC